MILKDYIKAISLCVAVIFISGFTGKGEIAFFYDSSSKSVVNNNSETCDSLVEYAKKFLKKPYCRGSRSPKCFDCSGFVNFIFEHFHVTMPRSSSEIATTGNFISFGNATAGDLVFFTGSNKNSEDVGHVGIVTKRELNRIYFIHASVQAGVIESHTEEKYYEDRLLFVKRLKIN